MIYYIEVNKRRRGKINSPNHGEKASVLSKTAFAAERMYNSGMVSQEEVRQILREMTGVDGLILGLSVFFKFKMKKRKSTPRKIFIKLSNY